MSGHDWWQRGADKNHKPGGATSVAPSTSPATPGKQTLVGAAQAGASDRRPDEALPHLRAAEITLDTLCAMGDVLEDQARSSTDSAPVVAFARTIVPIHRSVLGALTSAFAAMRETGDEAAAGTRRPIAAVERVTGKLAMYVAKIDEARSRHPQLDGVLSGSGLGDMIEKTNRIRGYLELEAYTRPEVAVAYDDMVRLGTGSPRDQIQDAVVMMAVSWNRTMSHFADAVGELVALVHHAEFKTAEPGFMAALVKQATGLLKKGSEVVAGTPLGATLGLAVIEKVRAHEAALERAREQADEQAFLAELHRRVKELQLEGAGEGGNQFISRIVAAADREFIEIGEKNRGAAAENSWKPGDKAVFGAQGTFLGTLTRAAEAYTSAVPTQAQFTSGFLVEWVNANHKRKPSPSSRMPWEDSTHWDGYVGCKIELQPWGSSWAITPNSTATLHCPKSSAVAAGMTSMIEDFHVGKIACPVHVEITCTDRDRLPPFLRREVPLTVRLDASHQVNAQGWQAWNWVQQETGDDADVILQRFRSLRG